MTALPADDHGGVAAPGGAAGAVAPRAGGDVHERFLALPRFLVLGQRIVDSTIDEVLALVPEVIALARIDGRPRWIGFANAHTLNVARSDPGLAAALRRTDWLFGDGAGVRWAVRRLYGHRLRDNVNGTDLVPRLLAGRAGRGGSWYLLGGRPQMLDRAAAHARQRFPDWRLVGCHHGYLDRAGADRVVDEINARQPDVLLVGMGHPVQEKWVQAHLDRLRIPLCITIGGLMAYWSGDLRRAPRWLRSLGLEWVHLMFSQPRKLPRYLLGNPAFVLRVLTTRTRDTGARPAE